MRNLEHIHAKIISGNELSRELAIAKFRDKKVVFTNGCFDIIHRGHVEYLSQAAKLGDIFIVGLNTDASVKRIKGESRPVQDEITRAMVLASMFYVAYVVLFDEDTPYNLINTVQPDILVKGGDYKIEDIVGYDIVKAKGGKTLTIPFVPGFSSTSIISRI
jgi:D-glycero-beta-D-manno-heptose 1-phosphate adenylyltransferase